MIGDIIKHLVMYRLNISPEIETTIICSLLLFLLFFGAFVRFKNGILSLISYIILVSIPAVLLTINIVNNSMPVEDLKLSDIKVERYVGVSGEGIQFRRTFLRIVNEPLLGIQPTTDRQRIDDFVAFIQRTYPDGNIAYRTSKKYTGIMLVDAASNDLNLALIKDGYFNIAVKAPNQYLVAANNARSRGVGVWASKVGLQPRLIEEITFYICCFMFGVVFARTYLDYKRRHADTLELLNFKENLNDKEKESGSRTGVEASDSTTSSGASSGS